MQLEDINTQRVEIDKNFFLNFIDLNINIGFES